jgi:hypothetical protein
MPTATRVPFADASPAELREAILPEGRDAFDAEYACALEVARDTLRLDELDRFLTRWRRVAWLQTGMGPQRWRTMLTTAAHINSTGQVPPGTVTYSADEVREQIHRRLAEAAAS